MAAPPHSHRKADLIRAPSIRQLLTNGRETTNSSPRHQFRAIKATPPRVPGILRRMIRKLKSGHFRLYSRKKNDKTGKRRNLGTFDTIEQARQHEREVQYFKRH